MALACSLAGRSSRCGAAPELWRLPACACCTSGGVTAAPKTPCRCQGMLQPAAVLAVDRLCLCACAYCVLRFQGLHVCLSCWVSAGHLLTRLCIASSSVGCVVCSQLRMSSESLVSTGLVLPFAPSVMAPSSSGMVSDLSQFQQTDITPQAWVVGCVLWWRQ